jgi:hypothetical protein
MSVNLARRITPWPQPTRPVVRPLAPDKQITVNLIPKAADDLWELQEATTLSVTDLTNRAISWYAFYHRQSRAGRSFLLRDTRTGEIQLVRLR